MKISAILLIFIFFGSGIGFNAFDSSPEKLHELLTKMKIWESAVANHFKDRIDNIDMDPMWARLMKVCIYLGSRCRKRVDICHHKMDVLTKMLIFIFLVA